VTLGEAAPHPARTAHPGKGQGGPFRFAERRLRKTPRPTSHPNCVPVGSWARAGRCR